MKVFSKNMQFQKIEKFGNHWTKVTNSDMWILVNWWTLKELSSPLKYDSSDDEDDVFFLSLWLAVFGHEEDILKHFDTVQVSQNPFLESTEFW